MTIKEAVCVKLYSKHERFNFFVENYCPNIPRVVQQNEMIETTLGDSAYAEVSGKVLLYFINFW